MELPPFSPDLRKRIEEILPRPGSSAGNPVDVANPFVPPKVLKNVLRFAAEDQRLDFQVVISLLGHYKNLATFTGKPLKEVAPYNELADDIGAVVRETGKPVVVVLINPKRGPDHLDVVEMFAEARRAFLDRGIPAFDDLKDAMQAVAHVSAYYGGRKDE